VARLEDRRAILDRSDPQSVAYVMRASGSKFGITYGGKELVPVADLVQQLFVEEFMRAGVEAKALPEILSKDGLPAMRAAGEKGPPPTCWAAASSCSRSSATWGCGRWTAGAPSLSS
jgi:hypothetical protein